MTTIEKNAPSLARVLSTGLCLLALGSVAQWASAAMLLANDPGADARGADVQPPLAQADQAPVASKPDAAKPLSAEERIEALEQRIKALEAAKPAQEQAIRSIIRNSLAGNGSRINEFVSMGGSLEVDLSRASDFSGERKESIALSTAELDFEINANEWVSGNLVLAYESANSIRFPTTPSFNTGTDRLTADKAFVVIGDTQKFPLYIRAGLQYLDFGSSTGVHRADVLSVANPLTVEAFELRAPAIGIGFGLPTPTPRPPEPPLTVPPVRPLVLTPAVESMAGALGYTAPPSRLKPMHQYVPSADAPPIYGLLSVYDPKGTGVPNRSLGSTWNGRLGYREKGHCGRQYADLADSEVCPWAIDFNVDYVSSIFDSRFLQSEYEPYLAQIGRVGAVATTLKATFGPWQLVGEWTGATRAADFVDGAGIPHHIRPSAWQASVGYQFNWNPWVEVIGEQGDFLSLGYSRSTDLAGFEDAPGANGTRAGFVPLTRMTLTAGEWVLEGTKVVLEYSRETDYALTAGGTGRNASEIILSLTYNF